ncbi:MAG: thioredoxin domain-containing protein [Anaerolineae bacterium]|nr:MAG: thioredoxin domain-containing protein [Anaerolineae bacterium]
MNRLAHATSPYLLQHAENPVDWYPWGEEALERARREGKPIFLSIGYAACHWCHVMAHESFEDPQIAALMNEYFVNIKVDREERPDLDALYMQAVVALTGQGGWPMSVFLTPDLRPFYGGTYFPPEPRYGMPSFRQVLLGVIEAWQKRREEIERIGSDLLARLQAQSRIGATETGFTIQSLARAAQSLADTYDWANGGWGAAPKFPQPMSIEFLFRFHSRFSPSPSGETEEHQTRQAFPFGRGAGGEALHALRTMAIGGMYDVVGGGFHRYATDARWLVPHFEKMLYDNAQLALAYLHAWQITADPFYRRICEETLDFIAREMTSPEGGFYSSLDADSEGVEGKFYVWTQDELRNALGEDAEFFETAYGVTARGNWEGKTVLQRALDDATLAARFALDPEQVPAKLAACHARLRAVRAGRTRPTTDDKVLTAWNALALSAFAQAARVLAAEPSSLHPAYYKLATRNAAFLLSTLRPEGRLRRAWRDGQTTGLAFLEDYAALIIALLDLYQSDFNSRWFSAAVALAEEMIEHFADPSGGFFDTTEDLYPPLLVRGKDVQDNATPSGNALAAEALLLLDALHHNPDWRRRAEETLSQVAQFAPRYPGAFARSLQAADFALGPVKQVAVVGDPHKAETQVLLAVVRSGYRPRLVVAVSSEPPPEGAPSLLRDRPMRDGKATAYVCEGFVCREPVTSPDALREQLESL